MSVPRSRGRTAVVLFVAIALIAAACGDDGDEAAEDEVAASETTVTTTTEAPDDEFGEDVEPSPTQEDEEATPTEEPDEPVELTATDLGVTESVITIGVLFPDLSVIDRDSGDVEAKWQTIVDRVNEAGGVNGRTLEMHFRSPNPLAPTEWDVMCTELTEDVGVFAMVGTFPLTTADCYAGLHDTIVVSTLDITEEQLAGYTAPGITLVGRSDRLVDPRVETLVEGGVLEEGMKVALLGAVRVEENQGLYREALAAAGIEVVTETVLLADGTDIPALSAEMEVFTEAWTSRGAEAIVATTALLSQALIIGYNQTGLDLPMILPEGVGVSPSLMQDSEGLDLTPFELAVSLEEYDEATQYERDLAGVRECVDDFSEASGEEVALDESRNNLPVTVIACQSMDIFLAIATAAGVELTTESFAAAAEALGPIVVTAVSEASLGPGKVDVSDSVGLISLFDPETAQFRPVE